MNTTRVQLNGNGRVDSHVSRPSRTRAFIPAPRQSCDRSRARLHQSAPPGPKGSVRIQSGIRMAIRLTRTISRWNRFGWWLLRVTLVSPCKRIAIIGQPIPPYGHDAELSAFRHLWASIFHLIPRLIQCVPNNLGNNSIWAFNTFDRVAPIIKTNCKHVKPLFMRRAIIRHRLARTECDRGEPGFGIIR